MAESDSFIQIHPKDIQEQQRATVIWKEKPGPKPLHKLFPEIIPEIERILYMNGYAAHKRRKPDSNRYYGTSMRVLTEHLLDTFPQLKAKFPKLSPKTIEHLFLPPHPNNTAAKDYYEIIRARPYVATNDEHPEGEEYHYCRAQVKLMEELFFQYPGSSLVLSYDNKNRVNIGIPCVNRLNKAKKWFLEDDRPKLPTHDYPRAFKIIPSVYLQLQYRKNDSSREETDHLGRKHIRYPHTGSVYVFNRPNRKHCNISTHISDLRNILALQAKPIPQHLLLLVDRGGDNTWKSSLTNVIQYGHLWEASSLLLLVITGYHPADSAFNPVERILSHMTFDLTGTIIPDEVEGRKVNSSSSPQLIKKLFEQSIGELNAKWDGKLIDEFPVKSRAVEDSDSHLIDHNKWHKYLMEEVDHDDAEMNAKVLFLLDHAVKTKDLIYFAHCYFFRRQYCTHCVHLAPSAMLQAIRDKYGLLPIPIKSVTHPGHYLPLLEINTKTELSSSGPLNACDEHFYEFDSKADMRRHFDLCHCGNPTPSFRKDYFRCQRVKNGIGCTFACDTRTALDEHISSNHPLSKKSQQLTPSSNQNVAPTEKHNSKRKGDELRDDRAQKQQKLSKGSRIRVWYSDKEKYFTGSIKKVLGNDQYSMLWDDRRAKADEVVELNPEHNSLSASDSDRWNFV